MKLRKERFEFITYEQAKELLDRQARKYLGMSGDEFRQRYTAGELDPCNSDVIRVSLLMPMATNNQRQ